MCWAVVFGEMGGGGRLKQSLLNTMALVHCALNEVSCSLFVCAFLYFLCVYMYVCVTEQLSVMLFS